MVGWDGSSVRRGRADRSRPEERPDAGNAASLVRLRTGAFLPAQRISRAFVDTSETHGCYARRMPSGPAARVGDVTAHGGALVPGPGSTNVFIGGMPAWRGVSAAAAAGIVASAGTALSAIMEAQATA